MTVQQMTLHGSAENRGSWPTSLALVVALAPLAIGIALAVAIDGKPELGPLRSAQVVWFLLVPLGALYPSIASFARFHAYAPTTILVAAAIAPSFALAVRLLLDPIARDAQGRALVDWTMVWDRAGPPAVIAVVVFVAVELATAGMRRGIVVGLAGAVVAAAIVLGAAWGLATWAAWPIQGPA
jgi:hypothetical protein